MTLKNVFTTIFLTLFIFTFSITLTLNFRPLYYHDIEKYDLAAETGYSTEEIKANYDTLIDYNNVLNRKELVFPTLPMSDPARIHFKEVKNIFSFIQIMLPISLICSIAGMLLLKNKKPVYLKLTSILSLLIPSILSILIFINWERVFVTFHKIFFRNDYWIFNEITDPIILLLPDEFFMHCAIMIIALIILSSMLCIGLYKVKTNKP